MIVEIFSHEHYFQAIKAGIKNPMLSINGSDEDLRFVQDNNVALISTHSSVIANKTKEFAALHDKGVIIFVFSTNDTGFMDQYLNHAASAFYPDFWDINSTQCKNSKCVTY